MNINELKEQLENALKTKTFEELKTLAKEAVTQYPEEAFGYAYLGEALLGEVPISFPDVELCIAKAAELEPKNTHYLTRFAMVKGMQGIHDAAQIIWGKVLALDPNHVEALLAKGAYQFQTNEDHEKALSFLDRAVIEDPTNANTYHFRAQVHHAAQNYIEALQDIQQATTLEPGFDKTISLLTISICKALGELEKTVPLYDELIEQEPDNKFFHSDYAYTLLELEQPSKALVHLVRADELAEHKDTGILYSIGKTTLEMQQYEHALEAFQTYLELKPEYTEAAFHIVDIHIKLEQYNEALQVIQKLEAMLDDEFTLDKARVLKGKILIELGKLQQAEDLLAPIGEKSGTHQADAYFHLGIIYKQQGNVLKSYVFLKEAAARSHEAAKQYIVDEFTEFLEKLREINMDSKKTAFSKNERSSFFNKIFGKLWVFNDLKSEGLASAGFTNEQVKTFKDTFSLSSLVVAEKGILMLSDDKEQMATYNIKKETANGAVIDFLPLDGVESYEVKLQLTKDGRLVFSKQKGELLVYKEQHPTQLAPAIKAIYQEKINVTDSQYLGNKVTPILEQIL